MKSLIVISCLLGLISLTSFVYWADSSADPEPVSPPVRLGVHLLDTEKRLGLVRLNEQIRGSFTIVNDTDRPIALGEPMKSCSCATAELERRELAPGEQCSLTFTIQTGSRRVPRVETIGLTYTTDGADVRELFARVYFVPKGVFEVDPVEVVLTRARPRASFVVRGDPVAERHSVIGAWSNHRCVKVDTRGLPTVTLELNLDTPDESILNAECVVYTNNPAEDTIQVPVRIRKE